MTLGGSMSGGADVLKAIGYVEASLAALCAFALVVRRPDGTYVRKI